MTDPDADRPPFTEPFSIEETGADWIKVGHRVEGHWWRFAVAEKNGRLQLVHEAHHLATGDEAGTEALAIDAYDTATLEARRRGMVD